MSNKFDVQAVEPTWVNSEASFTATFVKRSSLDTDLVLFFGASAAPPDGASRQNGRYFPLREVRLNGQPVVSNGSCNHVPTVDEMRGYVKDREQKIETARRKAQEAIAALEALGATL